MIINLWVCCQVEAVLLNYTLVRKIRIIILALVGLALLGGLAFFAIDLVRPKAAGIFVDTSPSSLVFLNGEQVGRTPFKTDSLEPGEVIVKLIPETFERPLAPFETKLTLVPGVETVIRREFGETQEDSAGEMISFERVGDSQTGLAIISTPDSARVLIDGSRREFTPFKTSDISPGVHEIEISADGYFDRALEVTTHPGYELTAIVELAQREEEIEEEPEVEEVEEEELVRIEDTSTGFLRVRGEPSTLGEEVGRVEPGDEFVLLETDERTGWFRIEFEEEEEGWISNQYASIVTDESSPTPTPASTQ